MIAKVQARADPERKAEYDRAYAQREEVRARRAAQRRAWDVANPEQVKAANRASSLRRRGSRPGPLALDYMAILENDPCSYCGEAMEHVDHIDSLKGGGDSSWDNLTAACASCNHAKRIKPLLVFLAWRT